MSSEITVSTIIRIAIISIAIGLVTAGWKGLDVWRLKAKTKYILKYITESKSQSKILKENSKRYDDNLSIDEVENLLLSSYILSSNKFAIKILIRANAGLFKAIFSKFIDVNISNKMAKETSSFNLTIADMLFTTKAKHSLVAYALVALAGVLHLAVAALTSKSINNGLLLFLAITFALIHLNQKILEFRIRKGFYGKNEYEAREMVSFLLNHSDKTDFTNGDDLKKLFPVVKESERETECLGGLAGVTK